MSRLDRDLMTNLPVKAAAVSSMTVIDSLQDMTPHEQMVGITSTFLLACEHHKVNPQDAFTCVDNIMNHAEGRRAEFMAVRKYMENEW
ncbi:hypothetical protein ABIE64_002629 [Thalassospira sp. MBR-102]|uniref:hypothetical protein n=1 Tax=Thalassospira sp. MBR-102 TaxID=3156466 RepID=UPI0033926B9A